MTQPGLSETGFKNHLRFKIKRDKPEKVVFGKDFAVFTFKWEYEANSFKNTMQGLNEYYSYGIYQHENSVCVVNHNQKEV